jgi:uncharacterized membrane protein
MEEILLFAVGLAALGFLLASPVLAIVAFVRSRQVNELSQRVARLETALRNLSGAPSKPPESPAPAARSLPPVPAARPAPVETPVAAMLAPVSAEASEDSLIGWEFLIGRKALGWAAVVVLIFATGFFLRYAFANRWIGPVGQIALGVGGGLALVVAGARLARRQRRAFAQMLTAAGIVLLYLATYSGFGFYHLIDQQTASVFLLVIVVESVLLALSHDAPAIAVMAVVGGLLTPMLMHSDHDQYAALFLYLAMLNAGVVGMLLLRAWSAVGILALVGTHGLFWAWYIQNYHPEKLPWALGFLGVIYLLYLIQNVAQIARLRRTTWADLVLMLQNAALWCGGAYLLLVEDYHLWLGTLAIAMAAVYAAVSRVLLTIQSDRRMSVLAIAIAAGFIAVAIPLQAGTAWVALGWAAEAVVLWWFGLRIQMPSLRVLGAVFGIAATARLLAYDIPQFEYAAYLPVLNRGALVALAATACLATGVIVSRRFFAALNPAEMALIAVAAVGCVLLVWWIVTVDLENYFDWNNHLDPAVADWHRVGQMSISAWWAVYATVVLVIGFVARRGLLRWTALALFGITVIKVFFWDMADLDEIYRIAAFFVLAVLLGSAAWIYQRVQPSQEMQRQ